MRTWQMLAAAGSSSSNQPRLHKCRNLIGFPDPQARMEVEAAAMQLVHCCCPDHVPALLMFDQSSSILAMQYLQPPHQKLLYAIRHKQVKISLKHLILSSFNQIYSEEFCHSAVSLLLQIEMYLLLLIYQVHWLLRLLMPPHTHWHEQLVHACTQTALHLPRMHSVAAKHLGFSNS